MSKTSPAKSAFSTPKKKTKKVKSLPSANNAASLHKDAALNSIAASSSHGIQCKHLPAMSEFLKLYNLAADKLRNHRDHQVGCCQICGGVEPPLFVCLQCQFRACWCSQEENHFSDHTNKMGHSLCVQVETGTIYCQVCKTFVFTDYMRMIWLECSKYPSQLIPFVQIMQNNMEEEEYARICPKLRGLYNLGNTCFMNSVLQCLLQNPFMAEYFLHPSQSPHRHNPKNRSVESCIACEMDNLFSCIYNGSSEPFATSSLLEAVWKNSTDLAGYEQQDAHEFLVTLRNLLHVHLEGSSQYGCSCIIHSIFSGVLQSNVKCPQCGMHTETLDPFLDISLEIPSQKEPVGLLNALSMFTGEETLQVNNYTCESCHNQQSQIYKKLYIKQQPETLVFHLKRFEHNKEGTKINTPVNFPLSLSLKEFMMLDDVEDDSQEGGEEVSFPYTLSGVIIHKGSLDSGHYVSIVQRDHQWFKICDSVVTICDLDELFSSNVYMLFYVNSNKL